MNDFPKRFCQRMLKIDKSMRELEASLKKVNPKIEVLEPSICPFCPNCGFPLFKTFERRGRESITIMREEFKDTIDCQICNETVERKEARKLLRIHKLIPSIKQLWSQNIWAEEYAASLIRSLEDWRTWTHVYVLGGSGILHEIDVLAIKKGYILIAECKTGRITREEVFNFWTKVSDIKSHLSILFLTGELPDPETREFLSKNPAIVVLENTGEQKRDEILEKLKKSVLGKI